MTLTGYEMASTVLAHVQDALAAADRPVAGTMVAVGAMVVDNPCGGMLSVAVERVYRTTLPWPNEAVTDDECGSNPIAVELVVRVDRCVPIAAGPRATPPPPAQVEAAYRGLLTDGAVVWNALTGDGVLGDDGFGDAAWVRGPVSQDFIGAEGGSIAVETRVTLGVEQDEWCVA